MPPGLAALCRISDRIPFRAASRIVLRELEVRVAARENFAFETTLAGRTYLRLVERLRHDAWRVELIYLALPSADMSR